VVATHERVHRIALEHPRRHERDLHGAPSARVTSVFSSPRRCAVSIGGADTMKA
jgi:hypothetical protein